MFVNSVIANNQDFSGIHCRFDSTTHLELSRGGQEIL